MIHVTIDEDTALDMLVDRVRFWTDDDDVVALFAEYYGDLIDEGAFEESEFYVKSIVDNDFVNNTIFGTREDVKDSFGDWFTEDNVLAEYKGLILYYAC